MNLVNELIEEDSADPLELAAALAKLVQGDQPLLLDDSIPDRCSTPATIAVVSSVVTSTTVVAVISPTVAIARLVACRPWAASAQRQPGRGDGRYRVDVGAHHGVKPGQIVVPSPTKRTSSRFIGNIDIADDFSTVDLPRA